MCLGDDCRGLPFNAHADGCAGKPCGSLGSTSDCGGGGGGGGGFCSGWPCAVATVRRPSGPRF